MSCSSWKWSNDDNTKPANNNNYRRIVGSQLHLPAPASIDIQSVSRLGWPARCHYRKVLVGNHVDACHPVVISAAGDTRLIIFQLLLYFARVMR